MSTDALFDLPPAEPAKGPAPSRPERRTSRGIAEGDVVEVDRKGRRFHALVTSIEQDAKGFHHLALRPFDRRISYRSATVRDVVTVYRRAAAH